MLDNFYAEFQIEGDKETRIDGGSEGSFLLQTVICEKETVILGAHGHTQLISGTNFIRYEII